MARKRLKVEAKPNVVVNGDANDSNEVDSGTPILLEANGAQRKRVRRPRAPRADQRGRALLRAHPHILSKHVAARSYEDLRRDPMNPLLIHESPSWRAVSV
jgi:hypothetical protein